MNHISKISSCKTHHDLQSHVNLKHIERYEYQCNECEFKSKDLSNIKKHMLKFHLVYIYINLIQKLNPAPLIHFKLEERRRVIHNE